MIPQFWCWQPKRDYHRIALSVATAVRVRTSDRRGELHAILFEPILSCHHWSKTNADSGKRPARGVLPEVSSSLTAESASELLLYPFYRRRRTQPLLCDFREKRDPFYVPTYIWEEVERGLRVNNLPQASQIFFNPKICSGQYIARRQFQSKFRRSEVRPTRA